MKPQSVSLHSVLDEVMQLVYVDAQAREIQLEAAYRGRPASHVHADPVRVRQVMVNLVSNAVKYNRPGGKVRVDILGTVGDALRVIVEDNGLGMTPQQLDHLFEPFNRLGREGSGIQGSGIGMALTRKLLGLMNGDIRVASEAGLGTQVEVVLPASETSLDNPSTIASTLDAGEPQGRVLYIEDNAENVDIVREMLGRWPEVEFIDAKDGQTGLAMAKRLQPDLILMDMRLPEMEGPSLLSALRDDPTTRDLKVIAVSASVMPDEVALAMRSGALDYWSKPLDLQQFSCRMQALLEPSVA